MKIYEATLKRVLDIFIVFTAVFILLPIIILIALLIKTLDSGPIIFTQKRIGRDGRVFKFYKFRSMPVNTGDISSDKVGEIKLSLIGQFIRRSNLDELPQLFNILKGDMSIVGPRPPITSQLDLITLRYDNGSISCRPGLTGLAQVSSFDGMSVNEKAFYDGKYAKNVSFINDLKIIFQTFHYLLKKPPVY